MKISTSSFYDRAATRMSDLNAKSERLLTEISGKKLVTPSQDAGGWSRLGAIKQGGADDGAYKANITLAQGLLAQTDGVLGSAGDQIVRARELAVRANSGTLTAEAKATIATELKDIRADLLALANTTDVRGVPVFGGGTDTPFTETDGVVGFAVGAASAAIPTGEGTSVAVGADGGRVFGGAEGAADIFATLDALTLALTTDGADVPAAVATALTGIGAVEGQVTTARASAGARAARLDIEAARIESAGIDREEARVAIEETDVPTAMVELQKTMTVLQATQAGVAKLSGLSLFDYLR